MMMKHVYVTLKVHCLARVRFPKSAREKLTLACLVQRRQPRVSDVIEFTDWVSILVQCASDMNRQAIDYNGYHHDTRVMMYFVLLQLAKLFFLL